jgi:hypothetical protein
MRHVVATFSFLGIATTALMMTGCPDRPIAEVKTGQGRVEYKDIPITVNRNLDLLFVIDNSPSMADKQQNLADNFPNFINVLSTIQGGLPDVHIGVVDSDLGSKGAGDSTPGPGIGTIGQGGCTGLGHDGKLQPGQATAADLTGSFISDIKQTDGTRLTNYSGSLATVFGKMAHVGAGGCGFEQHIQAMQNALDATKNPNFMRNDLSDPSKNAYLAVVFILDEDDCSMEHSSLIAMDTSTLGPLQSFRCTRYGVTCDTGGTTEAKMNQVGPKSGCHPNDGSQYLTKISGYVDFLKQLKGDPNKIIVAGIGGVTDPFAVELRAPTGGGTPIPALAHSCTYIGAPSPGNPTGVEVADPATRLKFFLDQFPNRSTFSTICQQDLSGGLQQIADLLKTVIGDPCITGLLQDVDPNTDGNQYECSVSDVTNQGKPNQTETVIPACDSDTAPTNIPCWHFKYNTMNCMDPAHPELKVERGSTTPAPESHEIAYCVTQGG